MKYFILSILCVLAVRVYIYQDVARRQTWKTDLYLGADGTSFVWQAIQYREHGLFSYGKPESKLYGLYDLLINGSGYKIPLSWLIGNIQSEGDLEWKHYRKIVIAQIIVSAITASVVYWVMLSLIGSHVSASLAVILFAFALPSASMPFMIFSETLFALWFLLGVVALIYAPRFRLLYFVSGLILGLAAYTRTVALYSVIPVGLIVWMQRDE